MKPLEPTSTVVRVAWNPFRLQLSTSSAYFNCFHYAASSIPVSNEMVSSTMWTEEAFQMTMSGHLSVTAKFWGKVYGLLGRSTLKLLSWGKCEERKELMQTRTLSCRIVLPLQQGHLTVVHDMVQRLLLAAELALWGWHLLPQKQVLVICGSVSVTAFRANLKMHSGRSAGLPGKSCTNCMALNLWS